MVTTRILALGGAGFDMAPHNVALHGYIVAQLGRNRPRICLLPTASGDPGHQIASFHSAFEARGALTSHLSLFRLGDRPVSLREHLLAQDAVYVGGGSLVNLVALWRAHGLDQILADALEAGVLMAGHSAGAMCWFESGITRSHGVPTTAEGLGILAGSACPHFDSDADRARTFREAVAGGLPGGLALDDHAGALFIGGELVELVSARRGAGAARISERGGSVVEQPLSCRTLEATERWREDEDLAEFRRVAALRSGAQRLSRLAAQ